MRDAWILLTARWLALLLVEFFLFPSLGQCQEASISRAYERATELLTQGDEDGMFSYLDSLGRAANGDPDVGLLYTLMRVRSLRYAGRTMDVFHILDTLPEAPNSAPVLLRFSDASERAQNFRDLDLYAEARMHGNKALELARGAGLFEPVINTINVLGEVELQAGRSEEALRLFAEAERLALEKDYAKGRCNALMGIGNVYYGQERDSLAHASYQRAMECARSIGAVHILMNAAINAASAISYMRGPQASIDLYKQLLANSQQDMDEGAIATVHANLGSSYSDLGEHQAALQEVDIALGIYQGLQDSSGMAEALLFKATALRALGRKDDALLAALACKELSCSPGLAADAALKASKILQDLGRSEEALGLMEQHRILSDSSARIKYGDRLALLEVQHGTALKERTIAEQRLSLRLERAEKDLRERERNIILVVSFALLGLATALWRVLVARKRLAAKERQLHAQQVDDLLHQQELKAMNAMLEGQEKERDRVAKDLHDRLGSMLSAIKHQVGALEGRVETLGRAQDDRYVKVNDLLDDAVGEVRRISHDLIATTLARFGLAKALEDLCASVRITGRLDVELRLFGLEQRLERSVEIVVYRIVQELVSNVLKHAKASELSVSVTRVPGRLSLIVADDGRGFDTQERRAGIGLENVQARAASVGATVQVDSTPGQGTTVSVECPVVE